jgi:hypothetical protein
MFFFRVSSIFWFIIGVLLLWVPISLVMNVWSANLKPATFKRWKPRRRTFFEWLYERDSTPAIFNKHDEDAK